MVFGNYAWRNFYKRARKEGCNWLRMIDRFPRSVLVTGCQRSGTTALTRIIANSDGMKGVRIGDDDELDAAMILSGYLDYKPQGRYCFQTTYLNECYREYFTLGSEHKIIFVLRNPYSVIRSMLKNWRSSALNLLFVGCGAELLNGRDASRYEALGTIGVSAIKKACLAYASKVSQVFDLRKQMQNTQLVILDYDDLVLRKFEVFPELYQWMDVSYRNVYADAIHGEGLIKSKSLSSRQQAMIESLCLPVYQKAKELVQVNILIV